MMILIMPLFIVLSLRNCHYKSNQFIWWIQCQCRVAAVLRSNQQTWAMMMSVPLYCCPFSPLPCAIII